MKATGLFVANIKDFQDAEAMSLDTPEEEIYETEVGFRMGDVDYYRMNEDGDIVVKLLNGDLLCLKYDAVLHETLKLLMNQ